jgi:hypothetical protein
VRGRLTGFAFNLGVAGPDNTFGFGLLNARNSLTQSFAPSGTLHARLYDATTGAIVQTVPAAGNGSYAFSGVSDGNYYVFAGQDQNGDQQIGVPDAGLFGRRWGSFGGTSTPTGVTVAGTGTYPASFTIARPIESEPNDATGTASALVVGGYVVGVIGSPFVDSDVYRVLIPQAGQYTFETTGYSGACGFALEDDTFLELFDVNGIPITSNDDIDLGNLNFCSRITMALSPGTYYLRVDGFLGGNYELQARSGN